eukprot:10565383-Alexandrium_andersonii.AAC.1
MLGCDRCGASLWASRGLYCSRCACRRLLAFVVFCQRLRASVLLCAKPRMPASAFGICARNV